MNLKVFLLLCFLIETSLTVDRTLFKTCEQSGFCRRCRRVTPGSSPYEFIVSTIKKSPQSMTGYILNNENGHSFLLKLEAFKDNTFKVIVDEVNPLKPRYRVVDIVSARPSELLTITDNGETEVVVVSGLNKAVITSSPFKIDFYQNGVHSLSVNAKGLMRFEHLRKKPTTGNQGEEDDGSWEEDFLSHHDSKPNGPEAVALDFTFPKADILCGIPEHADSFALKSTTGDEPYRLYNLDVFPYELDSRMAIYGAVPVIYGHGVESTTGLFWLNPSETWIDIYNSNGSRNAAAAHFMSESGIMEFYILLGPSPKEAFKQYTDLTGRAPLPQLFTLGYHQSRWNYIDDQDIATVHANFDVHDIPVDTFWLDIEYTDEKKYFTWDHQKFPDPVEMVHNLTAKGRNLVIIIDPHIKRDDNYFFHNNLTAKGFYVKNRDNEDFIGSCWPGDSSYIDFFDPAARKFYANQYLLENFQTTTHDVMFWNDMNEPSVFDGPEITMYKDNIHFGGWEHRHIHNLYGHHHIKGTFDGISRRSGDGYRPFILTRSHFAGSQRYAAIWTGDNLSEWGHLAISIKMCLSEAVAGISFCGADIGGFFGNPEPELFERWYQAGAFQPFMRSHSHIDTDRREPWLYPEDTTSIIREAIRKRYSYLPFWYTMFYEHEQFGLPIMRPLLTQYPRDRECFAIDNEYLLSDSLLVRPVLEKGVSKIDVYFPAKNDQESDFWYDIDTYQRYNKIGYSTISVDRYKIPVFLRGGSIIPKKERIRRASNLMFDDPYTLLVALDKNNEANGTLFIDDEKSLGYRSKKYIYIKFEYSNGVLTSKTIDVDASYPTKSWIERVVIIGLPQLSHSATLLSSSGEAKQIEVLHSNNLSVIQPGVSTRDQWSITLNL